MRDTSEAIREAVKNYFEGEGFKFRGFDENSIARTGFGVKAKFRSVELFLHAQPDRLQVRAMVPLRADEENISKVAEFLFRANYGMKSGGFDLDFDDGEISFRTEIYCGDEVDAPTNEQVEHAVDTCVFMVQRYGDGLAKVVYGMMSPKDAISEIEG